jgi:8-oxo-dGTP pyrophosphatase MutT (NUDIX family)
MLSGLHSMAKRATSGALAFGHRGNSRTGPGTLATASRGSVHCAGGVRTVCGRVDRWSSHATHVYRKRTMAGASDLAPVEGEFTVAARRRVPVAGSGVSTVTVPQVAVIPFQREPMVRVLLIRKLPSGDWGVPKGAIADHEHDHRQAARLECLEEAGADGLLWPEFVGEFAYRRGDREYRVSVLLMEVTGLRERYREMGHRERQWFSIDEAVNVLGRVPLRWLVSELPRWINGGVNAGPTPEPGSE